MAIRENEQEVREFMSGLFDEQVGNSRFKDEYLEDLHIGEVLPQTEFTYITSQGTDIPMTVRELLDMMAGMIDNLPKYFACSEY